MFGLSKALVDADSGKWLGILLRESGFGAQLVAGERASASDADNLSEEGIYDEVYNWEVYDVGGSRAFWMSSVFKVQSICGDCVRRFSSEITKPKIK